MGSTKLLVDSFLIAAVLKVLLFPTYHSTDFEVHRNWLALTSSLPVSKWYYEATSEWTLDYPPFFAYFEWALAQVAKYVDPTMLRITKEPFASWSTVAFQRTSVIVSEGILLLSLIAYVRTSPVSMRAQSQAAALSILLSPGLLIIDHIHFQYNGMMYGLMVLSLVLARRQSGLLGSGVLFAVLLCFKHIYAYVAPAYAAFLLGAYCQGRTWYSVRFSNVIKLGFSLIAVVAVAFGPFAYWGQMQQLLSRLFPFQRGLTHAYWAPNAWALYSFVDRVLVFLAPAVGLTRFGLKIDQRAAHSLTRGLVGDVQFAVLPDVGSRASGLLTLAAMLPVLVKVWLQPTWRNFISSVTLCGYASFLFGYHVHEKAILLVILPFSLIALTDRRHLSAFRPLATAGYVSLFPLLFDRATTLVKVLYTLVWLAVFNIAFERLAPAPPPPSSSSSLSSSSLSSSSSSQNRGEGKGNSRHRYHHHHTSRIFLLDRLSLAWDIVALPLVAYCQLGLHELIWGGAAGTAETRSGHHLPSNDGSGSGSGSGSQAGAKYPFLPLMFMSTYCALGVVGSWIGFMVVFFTTPPEKERERDRKMASGP